MCLKWKDLRLNIFTGILNSFDWISKSCSFAFSVSALYASLKSRINDPRAIAENDITVFQTALIEKSLKLCDILKYEFIFCKPCQELEHVICDSIRNLTSTGIISLQEVRIWSFISSRFVFGVIMTISCRRAIWRKSCGAADTRRRLTIARTKSDVLNRRWRWSSTSWTSTLLIRVTWNFSILFWGLWSIRTPSAPLRSGNLSDVL